MQGFKVTFNGQEISVGLEDGLLMIHLFDLVGRETRLSVCGVDYARQKEVTWLNCPLQVGDRIDLEFSELETVSSPETERFDETIQRPFTKLALLRNMEQYLKSKGLL